MNQKDGISTVTNTKGRKKRERKAGGERSRELDNLMQEHRALTIKKFSNEGLSASEQDRHCTVLARIDEIEEELYREEFKHLEDKVAGMKKLGDEIQEFLRKVK